MQSSRTLNDAVKELIETYGSAPLDNGKFYAYVSDFGYLAESPAMKAAISALSVSGVAKAIYERRNSAECQDVIKNFINSHPEIERECVEKVAGSILYAAGANKSIQLSEEKDKKRRISPWLWVGLAIAVAALAVGGIRAVRYMFPKSPEVVVLPAEIAAQIEGYYTVRLSDQEKTAILTGQVTKMSTETYTLYVATEYGPRYFSFSIDNDLHVTSEQLGEGSLHYRKDIHKTTITFNQSGSKCELSK